MIQPKTKEYEFQGEKIVFTERSAQDVFDLIDFINSDEGGDDEAKGLYSAVYIIYSMSLPYINKLSYFKRKKLLKIVNPKTIMRSLSPRIITEFSQKLLSELEGVTFDKSQEVKKKIQVSNRASAKPLPKD